MGVMDLKKISSYRKKVDVLRRKRNHLERILMGRSPMVAGSFIPRRFRPGAPLVYYLSASIRGESRHRYVRKAEVAYWHQRAAAWKKFIQAMAAWMKVNKEMEKALRKIGRLRCEPLPGGEGQLGRNEWIR
jgi:hypothetical protein